MLSLRCALTDRQAEGGPSDVDAHRPVPGPGPADATALGFRGPGRDRTAMPHGRLSVGDRLRRAPSTCPRPAGRHRARRRAQRAHRQASGGPTRRGRGNRDAGGRGAAGRVSRQLFLGDTLDTEKVSASRTTGVLTLRIWVAEQAKPRRIDIPTRTRASARSTPERRRDRSSTHARRDRRHRAGTPSSAVGPRTPTPRGPSSMRSWPRAGTSRPPARTVLTVRSPCRRCERNPGSGDDRMRRAAGSRPGRLGASSPPGGRAGGRWSSASSSR